ncbi:MULTISPECIES: hypothetical protein [Mycobacteriaceae]|uniref:hypothetical protein n=1 Tax=Mycobacteriaceae TaxID=1762 RepID=UPI0007EFD30D|nr:MULTISPECIES: hypothetical protein [Mycobacteriaceae]MDO2981374.1 hypothetical protein [Mycobacteroides abscessus subsp. abscessus]OBK56751.1 hypothetical protein A5654_04630 [Mycolicibacterium fortuitum]
MLTHPVSPVDTRALHTLVSELDAAQRRGDSAAGLRVRLAILRQLEYRMSDDADALAEDIDLEYEAARVEAERIDTIHRRAAASRARRLAREAVAK